jgi:hypothetical protein
MHQLALTRIVHRGVVLVGTLIACGVIAHPALAATRFASPNGVAPVETQCTDITLPCSLDTALQTAQDQDTLSLANGTYDVTPKAPPAVALHWVPTDPQTRPVIVSSSSSPTLSLTNSAQSGTTFDHLEIDNFVQSLVTRENQGPSALLVGPDVSATIRSSVIAGPVCIDARDAGKLEIDDSTLNTTFNQTCLTLNKDATVRRSTVGRQFLPVAVAARRAPTPRGVEIEPPVLVTAGLVEDSTINGGLGLSAPTSVARRVRSIAQNSGSAISGQGLVVDSLALSNFAPAVEAESDKGGTLVVLGSTAISSGALGLLSNSVTALSGATPNDLVVSNTIARGAGTDVAATPVTTCGLEETCAAGLVHIDHSDFTSRSPTTGDAFTEGAGNIAGDPLFADPAHGDFHLGAGSPAIDAGAVQDRALPSDLDGHPRVQGRAPDLGAFETPGPVPPGGGSPGPHSAGGGSVPKLGRLHVTPSRLRVGGVATIAFNLDTSSGVTLTFQRMTSGHRKGKRCVSGKGRGRRCTSLRTVGKLTVKNGHAGTNTLRFRGRVGGKTLKPGSYKLIALPGHGKAQSVRLTVLG